MARTWSWSPSISVEAAACLGLPLATRGGLAGSAKVWCPLLDVICQCPLSSRVASEVRLGEEWQVGRCCAWGAP